jgi:hypothetical protein
MAMVSPVLEAYEYEWWFGLALTFFGAWAVYLWLKLREGAGIKDGMVQGLVFIPWVELDKLSSQELARTIVVDCTHPAASVSLTHHRQTKALPLSLRGDASTDVVLNALEQKHPLCRDKQRVSCNHFDVDGYLSVLAALRPHVALKHNDLLRRAARIGDFRELVADAKWGCCGVSPIVGKEGYDEEAHALVVCCWINALEKQRFWRPFGKNESDPYKSLHDLDKWSFFLAPSVLAALEAVLSGEYSSIILSDDAASIAHAASWQAERDAVCQGCTLVANSEVFKVPEIGLVVVGPLPQPVHYYSLFGATLGSDIVLTLVQTALDSSGSGGVVAEVEQKYTTFVDLASRPTLPRIDLLPLAALLNALEAKHGSGARRVGVWVGERFVDSGPLLRLEWPGQPLTKASRYGHPSDRYAALLLPTAPHAAENGAAQADSNGAAAADADVVPATFIPVAVLVAAVEGYLRAAYGRLPSSVPIQGDGQGGGDSGVVPRSDDQPAQESPTEPRLGWTWKAIREFNVSVAGPRVRAWLWSEHRLRLQEENDKVGGEKAENKQQL